MSSLVVAGSESIRVSHEYIKCDGPFCRTPDNPKNRCARCQKHYYCSRECQSSAWKAHKSWCKATTNTRNETVPNIKAKGSATEETVADNAECGICLESLDKNNNVVVLKNCQHGFCYQCIKQWEDQKQGPVFLMLQQGEAPTCPLCRSDIRNMDVEAAILDRSNLYKLRAGYQTDSVSKQKMWQLALDELEKIIQGKNLELQEYMSSPALHMAFAARAGVHLEMGMYQEALDFAELSLSINGFFSFNEQVLQMLLQAEALLGLGKLDLAMRLRFEIMEVTVGRTFTQWIDTNCCKFGARLWFEIGNWEFASRDSERAIRSERFHFGVHKYGALAARGEGNLPDAVQIMSQAVLFEVHEVGSMEGNIRLLRQYQAEEKEKGKFLPYPYPSNRPSNRCGICNAVGGSESVILSMCQHHFCYLCFRGWWLQYAEKVSDNKQACYKGLDASCPACRESNGID